jgi:hypothetical protein
MNANELADALDWVCKNHLVGIGDADFKATANMLRQQQVEINSLRNNGYKTHYELLRLEFINQQAEIESLLKFIGERGEAGQLIIWKAQEK